MRTKMMAFGFSMLLGGCIAEDADLHAEGAAALAGSITLDSTAIATAPPATLPAAPLSTGAFAEDTIKARLIRTAEAFQTIATVRSLEVRESTTWHLERDASAGRVLFVRRVTPGAAVALDDATLQQTSLQRLADWGLGGSEVLRALQRRSLVQDESSDAVGATRLHRYKTFVIRGVNSVPVEGHRAVLTYSPDGVLHRALVLWPALAASGHQLRTTLTRAQIESRAITALQAEGVTEGSVTLRWKYVPTLNANGEAVLTLRVGARTRGAITNDMDAEAREVDVDVSATP